MTPILDLQGRSGAAYRFRLVPQPGELPAHAGNFVLVRQTEKGPVVLGCGARRSLVELVPQWKRMTVREARVYVRLNVSRAQRLAEHEDLVAALPPRRTLLDAD